MAELRTIPAPVNAPFFHRATAWFCLALVLLTGLTPAQGFVLCIEQDGCVSFEIKAPGSDCTGCEAHEESAAEIVGTERDDRDPGCPCIDLAVPGWNHERTVAGRLAEIHVGPWIAPGAEARVETFAPLAEAVRGPPSGVPRVAQSLTHLQSVVLLV